VEHIVLQISNIKDENEERKEVGRQEGRRKGIGNNDMKKHCIIFSQIQNALGNRK
jgi:predicted transposase YdaD